MEGQGQRERTSGRRRQRRKAKVARGKVVVEPVLIAARRPDSPRMEAGFRATVASAQPKLSGPASHARTNGHGASHDASLSFTSARNGNGINGHTPLNGSDAAPSEAVNGAAALARDLPREGELDAQPTPSADGAAHSGAVRRRAVRIVKVSDNVLTPGNREQQLLDRLVHSQGRGAISRAADDLWESKFVAPKRQEVQIQLLEHENEHRARDAVFIIAELLQREAPIKRPVLDQRLRRLETSAEDPITRDAAGALRRSMRVHHGGL